MHRVIPKTLIAVAVFGGGLAAGFALSHWWLSSGHQGNSWAQISSTVIAVLSGFALAMWQAWSARRHKVTERAKTLKQIADESLWCMTSSFDQLNRDFGAERTEQESAESRPYNPLAIKEIEKSLFDIQLLDLPHELIKPILKIRYELRVYIGLMDDLLKVGSRPRSDGADPGLYLRLMNDSKSRMTGYFGDLGKLIGD